MYNKTNEFKDLSQYIMNYASTFGLTNSLISPNQVQLSLNVCNNLANKNSQWLTLEVCREHQRCMCPRSDLECKYAHPPPYLETLCGRVMCCYDSIKGKCHRVKPSCKYFHPPQHLKDILIQNGKNNLLMKNLQMNIMQQQLSSLSGSQQTGVGLIALNTKPNIESQKSQYNKFKVPDDVKKIETTFSTEFQNDMCLSKNIPNSRATSTSLYGADKYIGEKRSLAQLFKNGIKTDCCRQHQSEECFPSKRPKLSEVNLCGSLMNRMGYIANPFLAYQNPLATFLSLNNPTTLAGVPLNPPFPAIAQGFISSPQINANNLSIIGHFQNQQNLTMILNAANNFHGETSLTQFPTVEFEIPSRQK